MTNSGFTTPGMAGLEMTISGEDCTFLLRRLDFASDRVFGRYQGTELRVQDIVQFLPNWSNLSWTPVPDSLLSHSESCARDKRYQINVWALPSSTKQHPEVISAFLRFMARS